MLTCWFKILERDLLRITSDISRNCRNVSKSRGKL